MTELLVIGREEVRALLPMADCLALMDKAFRAVSDGRASQELRTVIPLSSASADCFGLMPGSLSDPACFGVKVVSVFPGNFGSDLQTHQGAVILFERARGRPLAVIHAGEITAIRTAAASAVATRALARPDASRLALIGYGEQASEHVEAIRLVRPIRGIRVWGRSFEKASLFAERMKALHGCEVMPAHTVAEAVDGADIVCTVSAAPEPVLGAEHLAPGMHLNVVGSSVAQFREVDDAVVARARLFVDYEAMTRKAGGEFISALAAGVISHDHIVAEMGSVLAGSIEGRRNGEEITLFKSLGMPAEDLYAAHYVYERALARSGSMRLEF